MSRCSLQLYVNKNFTFSRPSLASSDEFLKNLSSSDWKKTSLTTSHNDAGVLRNYTLPINKNCVQERLSVDHYDGYHPILTSYLLRHTRSVEAYRRIRKQQEEILNLCRKKLSKKLSGSFLSGIRDEDIIKALKIIQDTELQQNKPNTSDNIIRRVLKGIISNDSKWSSKAERNGQTSAEERVLKCLSQNISYSSGAFYKPRKGYSAVLKKLRTLFKKPRIYTNPFRVANKLANPTTNAKSKASLCCPTKSVDSVDDNHICPYNIESLTENIRIYASPAYGETSQNPHIGMGSKPTCACHRNLVKLQNEFIKQQSEIRLINQNLEQCLCILHDIGDKPQASRTPQYNSNPFKKDIQVYNVAANPPSGPYGDRYYVDRTPKLIAYQDPSTPTRIQVVTEPKKKGGGCCSKTPKILEITCPRECPYSKFANVTDSNTTIYAQQSSALIRNKQEPKGRTLCGCCGKRDSSVSSTPSKKQEMKALKSAMKGARKRAARKAKEEEKERRRREGEKTKCCGKKRRTNIPPNVCNELCARWSQVNVIHNMTNAVVQTIYTPEFGPLPPPINPGPPIIYEMTTPPDIIAFPRNGRHKYESEPIIRSDGKAVRCTRRRCSPKKGKSMQCQCHDCKKARKKVKGTPQSTPSTASTWTSSASGLSRTSIGKRLSKIIKSRSRLGKSRSRLGKSRSRLGKSRSKLGKSRSRLGKSRSRLGRSRSNLGRSRSRLGRRRSRLGKSRSRLGKRQSKMDKSSPDKNNTPLSRSRSHLGVNRSRTNKSKRSLRKSRSKIGKSRSRIRKSRSRIRKSKSKLGRSKSKIGKGKQGRCKRRKGKNIKGPMDTSDSVSGVTATSELSIRTTPSEASAAGVRSVASGTDAAGSIKDGTCNDKKKPKRPCCLVRFCKLYMCRG